MLRHLQSAMFFFYEILDEYQLNQMTISPLRRRIHNSDRTARHLRRTRYLQDTLRRSPPFKKRNRHLCQRVGMADLAEGKGG